MEFKKFTSIENASRKQFLDQLLESPQIEWVAQEKIHGSNFGICTDGTHFQASKRSSFVSGNSFYNAENVLNENKKAALKIFKKLKGLDPLLDQIHIFGEICGGLYPNAKHTTTWEPKQVQKEVKYSPDQEFICFDIRIDKGENHNWVSIDEVERLCQESGMLYTPIMHRGNLKELLKLNPEFISPIYKFIAEKKGLDLAEVPGNWSEGYVLKPNHAFQVGPSRAILKHKSARFGEKSLPVERKKEKGLDDNENRTLAEMLQFMNENRLRNVLSKLGPVQSSDFGRILKNFNIDILEDWEKETGNPKAKENSKVTKALAAQSAQLIRKNFVNILDGNF